MRTDDIIALCNHPPAQHGRAYAGRSILIYATAAAFLIGIALINAFVPTVQAYVPKVKAPASVGVLDLSGTPVDLPLLF